MWLVSLFTNAPLPENIEIISNYLHEENKNIMPIERKVFQQLMFIAIRMGYSCLMENFTNK